MNILIIYVISQILIIFNFVLSVMSYHLNNKKKILVFNFIGTLSTSISYLLLHAYSGFTMSCLSIVRNILFLNSNKGNSKNIRILYLLIVFILIIVFTIITFEDVFSLLPGIATLLYTYSLWDKKVKNYKLLGIPNSIIWLIYNMYINSIMGIVFGIVLLISSTVGSIKEKHA